MLFRNALLAAVLAAFSPSLASAVITHYNVDQQTTGGTGPVTIQATAINYAANVYTIDLLATNNGATPLTDVRMIGQFLLSNTVVGPGTFDDATDTWVAGTDTFNFTSANVLQGANGFLMADTDAPLVWPPYPASLLATDTVPQVLLGNMAPAGTFAFTVTASASNPILQAFVASAIAAVPEPSTFVMGALGGAALLFAGWRRRR